jgi:type I restriction-modification system DNA methylase subunit
MAGKLQIQESFQKIYDLEVFKREILNSVFTSGKAKLFREENYIDESNKLTASEKKAILKVVHYGNLELDDYNILKLYEITLQPSVRIEQSKVGIQQYVRKMLIAGEGVLVNFINPDNLKTWRLTLVASDTVFTGKGISVKKLNPKRYTFIVGQSEKCKTISDRFAELEKASRIILYPLENEKNAISLVNTFSVETLSKAFFDEYTLHYSKFVESIEKSNYRKSVFNIDYPLKATKKEIEIANKPIRDFVKKLLGRIVFLYFVQKKGWLGASNLEYKDGDPNFIFNLFMSSGANETYYSDWLAQLFFKTLNEQRTSDVFKMPDNTSVKIPYLNGGLFDPEDYDNKLLTFVPSLFHSVDFEDTPLTDKLIKKKDVNHRGFLDFLNSFNFTVHEDSPEDHTVAVDPEMLGHIFENLLEDNKDKGAFYTPREIVHYMCQESLIEYLNTHLNPKADADAIKESYKKQNTNLLVHPNRDYDENYTDIQDFIKNKTTNEFILDRAKLVNKYLDNVKICDPAIGSGAFPMGLLQEIFAVKELIAFETSSNWEPAKVKENIIQNSIYGVDIEKGAVDIARLRFWLSLIVNEEKPKALPNLDYKIVVGNSLISRYNLNSPIDDVFEIINRNRKNNKLQPITLKSYKDSINDYMYVSDSKSKKEYKELIAEIKEAFVSNYGNEKIKALAKIRGKYENLLRVDIFGKTIGSKTEISKAKKELEAEENKRKEAIEGLFYTNAIEWRFEFPNLLDDDGNFIGFDIVIANPPYIGQKGNKQLFEPFVKHPAFEKKMDYWYFFLNKSFELSKDSAVNTFITPNYWITAQGGKKIRKHIIDNYSIVEFINFNDNAIFAAGVHTNIFTLKKNEKPNQNIRTTIYQNKYNKDFLKNQNQELNFVSDQNKIFNNWTGFIHFLPADVDQIINQLYDNCDKLSDNESEGENFSNSVAGKKITDGICNINQGIITGKDRFKDKDIDKNEGVYVLNDIEFNNLNFNSLESNYIKNFIKNSEISKYTVVTNPENKIIYVDTIENPIEFEKLTNIKNHLENYREILSKRYINGVLQSAYKKGKWWALIHSVPLNIIKSPKIVCPQRSRYNVFGYDDSETYASADVYYISLNKKEFSLKYILSILNSKIVYFWLYWMGKRKGEMLELYFEPLQFIPIKKITAVEQSFFIKIADFIIFLKQQEQVTDINKLFSIYFEQIIDGMVYELYFPETLKQHKRTIIEHLGELPAFTDTMSDTVKTEIVTTVFDRLNDKNHPVRVNLLNMNSIPEIKIIEGK